MSTDKENPYGGCWLDFFRNAGILPGFDSKYAQVFEEHRIKPDMLCDLTKECLRELEITAMGDIIAILRYAKVANEQIMISKSTGCAKYDRSLQTDLPRSAFDHVTGIESAMAESNKSTDTTGPTADEEANATTSTSYVPPLQLLPQEIVARLNQPPVVGMAVPGAQNSNAAALGNIQHQLGLGCSTKLRDRRVIWQGNLEWRETKKGTVEGLKTLRQVPCQVSSTVVNAEPEVTGDGWPSKLIMQLIPKHIVGYWGGTYFLDVKKVLFILQDCEDLVSLTKVMDSGFAGFVHFTGMSMPQNACTIEVLILMYSKERNMYLGFLPNDHAGIVDRIRKVTQHQKTQHAVRGTAYSIPQLVPGSGMQGGMVIQGQGQDQQRTLDPHCSQGLSLSNKCQQAPT